MAHSVFLINFAHVNYMLKIMFGSQILFMNLGPTEILIIALVVLLLFGGKKIPELMKGLGKGVKNFKEGMNEVTDVTKEEKRDE